MRQPLLDSVCLVQIDKDKAKETNCGTEQFIPRKRLVVKKIPHKQEQYRDECTLDNKSRVYLPACLVGIEPSAFQTDNYNTQSERCPVQSAAFSHEICLGSKYVIKNGGENGTCQVGDSQGSKWMDPFRCGFRTDVIQDIRQNR